MNVSVLKKKVCLLYYLCLLNEKYFLFFVVLCLYVFHSSVEISSCLCKVL